MNRTFFVAIFTFVAFVSCSTLTFKQLGKSRLNSSEIFTPSHKSVNRVPASSGYYNATAEYYGIKCPAVGWEVVCKPGTVRKVGFINGTGPFSGYQDEYLKYNGHITDPQELALTECKDRYEKLGFTITGFQTWTQIEQYKWYYSCSMIDSQGKSTSSQAKFVFNSCVKDFDDGTHQGGDFFFNLQDRGYCDDDDCANVACGDPSTPDAGPPCDNPMAPYLGNHESPTNGGSPAGSSPAGNNFLGTSEYTGGNATPLHFESAYNSLPGAGEAQAGGGTSLGKGWMHTYGSYLDLKDPNNLVMYDSQGAGHSWQNDNSSWSSVSDPYGSLTILGTGDYQYTNLNGYKKVYGNDGKLKSLEGKLGSVVNVIYDDSGRIDKVEDNQNRTIQFNYDGSNTLIESLTLPNGKQVIFGHVGPQLESVTTDNGSGERTVKYYYKDATSKLLTTVEVASENFSTHFDYDSIGRLIESYNGTEEQKTNRWLADYSSDGKSVTITSPNGKTWQNNYETIAGLKRLVSRSGVATSCTGSGCDNTVVEKDYDDKGNLIYTKDVEGIETKWFYTPEGRHKCRINAWGKPEMTMTTFAYDTVANQMNSTTFYRVANGANLTPNSCSLSATIWTSIKTDEKTIVNNQIIENRIIDHVNGQVSVSKFFYYPVSGLLKAVDGPRVDVNDITYFEYDNQDYSSDGSGHVSGFLTTRILPNGYKIKYSNHDSQGRAKSVTDANNVTTEYSFTTSGKVRTFRRGLFNAEIIYDDLGRVERVLNNNQLLARYEYTQTNLLFRVHLADGSYKEFEYDGLGNRIKESNYSSTGTLITSQTNIFDNNGQIAVTVGGEGEVTRMDLDGSGRLKALSNPRHTIQNPNSALTTLITNQIGSKNFTIDGLGRIISEESISLNGNQVHTMEYKNGTEDRFFTAPNGVETLMRLDGRGNITFEESRDYGQRSYGYSPTKQIKTYENAKGQITTFTYDALNRVKTRISSSGAKYNVNFNYDEDEPNGRGRLTSVVDRLGTTRFAYNELGQIVKRTVIRSGFSYKWVYGYNNFGNLTSITYPSGNVVYYDRENSSQLINRLRFKRSGSVTTLVDNIKYVAGTSLTQSYTLGNGINVNKVFDKSLRLQAASYGDEYSLNYDYYLDGSVKLLEENMSGQPRRLLERDYSDHGYLNSETEIVGSSNPNRTAIFHDNNGNIMNTEFNGVLQNNFVYDASTNKLRSVNGALNLSIGYTKSGEIANYSGNTLTYDEVDLLASFKGNNGLPKAVYDYNYRGLRVRKSIGGFKAYFAYLENGLLAAEFNQRGLTQKEYIYLGQELIAINAVSEGVIDVQFNNKWRKIPLFGFDNKPVVLATPPTRRGADEGVIRIKDITNNSMSIAFSEWSYQNNGNNFGGHGMEEASILALPEGHFPQTDGSVIIVGRANVSSKSNKTEREIKFDQPLPGTPFIISTLQTTNGQQTVVPRIRSVTKNGFRVLLQEQESSANEGDPKAGHGQEELGYLAIYTSTPNILATAKVGNKGFSYRVFKSTASSTPKALGTMKIFFEEEKSRDEETNHLEEPIDVIDIGGRFFVQDTQLKGSNVGSLRFRSRTLQKRTDFEFVFTHIDHMGAPRVATNNIGKLAWYWPSNAFGKGSPIEDMDGDGTLIKINHRFPGQYFDEESGLHYNWRRYYSPDIGRYIQPDPIGLEGGSNPYIYAYSDPVNYIDPQGLYWGAISNGFNGLRTAFTAAAKHTTGLLAAMFGVSQIQSQLNNNENSSDVPTIMPNGEVTFTNGPADAPGLSPNSPYQNSSDKPKNSDLPNTTTPGEQCPQKDPDDDDCIDKILRAINNFRQQNSTNNSTYSYSRKTGLRNHAASFYQQLMEMYLNPNYEFPNPEFYKQMKKMIERCEAQGGNFEVEDYIDMLRRGEL
ncbi:MAG: RHS repeat-associated core domain-containing protein [Bdellovibrionales bacterium]|nr:RHS repeat-associated core domain-containing protein [Bdellovibrionales bacterium]